MPGETVGGEGGEADLHLEEKVLVALWRLKEIVDRDSVGLQESVSSRIDASQT